MTENEKTLYELIGGETKLRSLVDHFYDAMDSSPEAAKVRAIHPDGDDGDRARPLDGTAAARIEQVAEGPAAGGEGPLGVARSRRARIAQPELAMAPL